MAKIDILISLKRFFNAAPRVNCSLNWSEVILKNIVVARGGGLLQRILGGGVPPGSSDPDPISDQKNVILHTRFQTRTLKSIPIFRPGL